MTPVEYIRKEVFKVSQSEFAEIAGVSQATISRWEAGLSALTSDAMARIRYEAVGRGIDWDDSLFFAPHVEEATQ